MSPKPYSLAVEEIKEGAVEEPQMEFEPQLKVLVNERWNQGSDSIAQRESVSIRGRITVSF